MPYAIIIGIFLGLLIVKFVGFILMGIIKILGWAVFLCFILLTKIVRFVKRQLVTQKPHHSG